MRGMHWEVLIIPLIALGVWILGTIFRTEEEKARNRPRRPGEGGGRSPQRRTTELDRFLEEARRRREVAERRQQPEPSPRPPEPRPQAARPPAPPRPPERRPARTREAAPPQRPAPVARRQVEPAGAPQQPTAAPVVAEAVVVVEPPVVITPSALLAPVPVPPPAPRLPPPSAQRPRTLTPVAAQVQGMLRNPQNAAAAVVLSEIFGPPLCRRKR